MVPIDQANADYNEVCFRVMVQRQQSGGSCEELSRIIRSDFGVWIRPQTLAKMDEGQLIAHIVRNKP